MPSLFLRAFYILAQSSQQLINEGYRCPFSQMKRLRIMVPIKTGISSPLPGLWPISCAHESTQYMLPPLLLLPGFRSFWKA